MINEPGDPNICAALRKLCGRLDPHAECYNRTDYRCVPCRAADEIEQLREILEYLVDLQNGPPLYKYVQEWHTIMARASAILGREEAEQYYLALLFEDHD